MPTLAVALVAWTLIVYGITLIVTGSHLFKPVRRRTEPYPYLYKLFSCPMCFSFWVGIAFGIRGIGPGQFLPLSLIERILSDGCAASAACWIIHVLLVRLGSEKL